MKDRGIDALVNDSLVGTGTYSLLFSSPHILLHLELPLLKRSYHHLSHTLSEDIANV